MSQHVKGHFRHHDGKLIWVAEHDREGAPGHKVGLFDDWSAPVKEMLAATPPGGFNPANQVPDPTDAKEDAEKIAHSTAGLASGTDLGAGLAAPDSKEQLTKEHFQDVGIKIGGAAKDMSALKAKYWKQSLAVTLDDLEAMEADSPELAHQLLTKEQQLGSKSEFMTQIKNQGATPGCAYLAGRLYTAIDTPIDTPAGRKAFALGLNRIMEAVSTWKTLDDAANGLQVLHDEITGFWMSPEDATKYASLQDALAQAKLKYQAMSVNSNGLTQADKNAIGHGYHEAHKAVSNFKVEALKKSMTDPDNPQKNLKALGESFFKLTKDAKKLNAAMKQAHDIEKTVGWEFMEKKAAEAGAQAKEKVYKPWHNWVKPESEAYEKEGGAPSQIYVAQTLKDVYGIKGVEYGSWMSQDASQHHTQACGEALADLAMVLGIAPQEVSLNGRLSLAFGARGKGKAKAHYEPAKKAINLTKMAGGGSLAHEFGHAMDNIVAMVSTGGKTHQMAMMTDAEGVPPGQELPTEVVDAFKGVYSAMHEGDFQAYKTVGFYPDGGSVWISSKQKAFLQAAGGDAQKALEAYIASQDFYKKYHSGTFKKNVKQAAQAYANITGKPVEWKTPDGDPTSHFVATGNAMGAYWGNPAELFARAFESFVMDKMKSAGMKNTYLVSGVAKEHAEAYGQLLQVLEPIGGKTSVYPLGAEREKINAAFENLVNAMKTHKVYQKALVIMNRGLFD